MKVGIIGGKLQGVESAFLARQAGWKAVVVDKSPCPPASGICDFFYQCDVVNDTARLCRLMQEEALDLIIPALEDPLALRSLQICAATVDVPLAYDAAAYSITSSKNRSNRLFKRLGIPMPLNWPYCGFPLIAKPSVSSGSQGVAKIDNEKELGQFLRRIDSSLVDWVLQEYLDGPSYSIEVLGANGDYTVVQVTELQMDAQYDCKRVIAPACIPSSLDKRIKKIAIDIAAGLHLKGIMDVELILDNDVLKVLEIDARLPSQTPAAVYSSTGINMLEMVAEIFIHDILTPVPQLSGTRSVIYEHVRVARNKVEILGEHIMTEAGPLDMIPGFCGAEMALTNFNRENLPLAATLIITGDDFEQAWIRRGTVIENIVEYLSKAGAPDLICNGTVLSAGLLSRG